MGFGVRRKRTVVEVLFFQGNRTGKLTFFVLSKPLRRPMRPGVGSVAASLGLGGREGSGARVRKSMLRIDSAFAAGWTGAGGGPMGGRARGLVTGELTEGAG